MFDVHSHLMPGVDDGAADPFEAGAALERMWRAGITGLVTTPHLRGSLTQSARGLAARLEELDAAWSGLRELARGSVPELRLERGAEVMLDTPEVDFSDPRVRLGGTSFALVEFAGFAVPPSSASALQRLKERGVRPVLAHPERYRVLQERVGQAEEWRSSGALLQVNAGSVVGHYGKGARLAALEMLRRGWVDYVASDYHARGSPATRECREALLAMGAAEQVELLMEVNPRRILADEPPLEVPPLAPRPSVMERIRGWLGPPHTP